MGPFGSVLWLRSSSAAPLIAVTTPSPRVTGSIGGGRLRPREDVDQFGTKLRFVETVVIAVDGVDPEEVVVRVVECRASCDELDLL